jgi:L-lactate dehydrogenase (FMN-dependent) and related alpha-hydroxy acid dehydrogenases
VNHIDRKNQHIELALAQSELRSPFDRLRITHRALPEVNLSDIDLSTRLLGPSTACTTLYQFHDRVGPARAETINRHLAEGLPKRQGWAMGVGSQRIGLNVQTAGLAESIRPRWQQPLLEISGRSSTNLVRPYQSSTGSGSLEADPLFLPPTPWRKVFQRAANPTAGVIGPC